MQQFGNKDIIGHIIRSVIDVIRRRTSEGYALIVIGNVVRTMSEEYAFLNGVRIKGTQYDEIADIVAVDDDVNYVDEKEIGAGVKDFIENVTTSMGSHAGYFFIKEVKEELPYYLGERLKNLGIDLNLMQLQYFADKKKTYRLDIDNADVFKYVIKALFDTLDGEIDRNYAVTTMTEVVERFVTKYEMLKYVKINDIRTMSGVDVVSIMPNINDFEPKLVGNVLQKIIMEVNNSLKEKGGLAFIEKIKRSLTEAYLFKMEEMGVDLHVVQLQQGRVVKHVLKALLEVLSDASAPCYAILMINGAIKKTSEDCEPLKYIEISSTSYSNGADAISILSEIETVRPSELGRGLQKMIEKLILTLGEEAGEHFIDRFKERLGKAYLLRIEEIGVNLHMVELRRNLLW